LEYLYAKSGIETRYSCLPDAQYPSLTSRYAPQHPLADAPTTSERMAIYEQEAATIGVEAARRALADYAGARGCEVAEAAEAITHLIVVSCTGFYAPGLDQAIARHLHLRPTVERTLIGFMGCAAAFNALRLAGHIVQADPDAQVLIVCVELCSLHVQPGTDRTNLIVASLFADGAAACLVGTPRQAGGDCFVVDGFHTSLQPDSTTDMVWHVGDYGFSLELSALIPRRLEQAAPEALRSLVDDPSTLQFWAIHPGGRQIVDRLVAAFGLSTEQAEPSRSVLRDYGNMSSPTVLFVLKEWRDRLRERGAAPLDGVMMAFGPGLVTEMAHLVYMPAATRVDWPARRQGVSLEVLA
jgi:predicted naringenin-chalcone synthase